MSVGKSFLALFSFIPKLPENQDLGMSLRNSIRRVIKAWNKHCNFALMVPFLYHMLLTVLEYILTVVGCVTGMNLNPVYHIQRFLPLSFSSFSSFSSLSPPTGSMWVAIQLVPICLHVCWQWVEVWGVEGGKCHLLPLLESCWSVGFTSWGQSSSAMWMTHCN